MVEIVYYLNRDFIGVPYIDLRDENLDGGGLSSMDRMCVKTD